MLVVALVALLFCFFTDSYSINHVDFPHEITKISLRHDEYLQDRAFLEFTAFGKIYKAIVHSTLPPLHPHFRALDSESQEFITELDGTYTGHLKGQQKNRVHISRVPGGAFLGFVKDGEVVIHLEPASTHIPDAKNSDTIIYKEDDLSSRPAVLSFLGETIFPPTDRSFREKREHPFADYVRSQKSIVSLSNERKNRCPLKIVADHRFFKMVGKKDKATTARYIMNTVAKVNELFEVVNWDEDQEDKVENRGRFKNMGFSIKEMKIWDKPTEQAGHYNGNDTENDGVWSSSRLLEAFTRLESSPKYCIVHLMTAQSFSDRSSLGLAYVATIDEAGGICADPREFGDRTGSYNTLFTSVIGNSGKMDYPLVTREAEIVVAHEYGHSWGAIHDELDLHEKQGLKNTCIPDYRHGGKYIMNPFAQAGFDPNNNRFSPCSIHMIRKMLVRRWNKCFEVEQTSLCGNGVIEEGEQCDEGALLPTSTDSSCCSRNCTLLPSAQCSPLNMPCCSAFCSFRNSSHVCLPSDPWQCKSKSYCTGRSGECPSPQSVRDKTVCADNGECLDGNCIPYCEVIGKKSCICEEVHQSCKRCCRDSNGTGPCTPQEGAADLVDGSWCVQGYCKNSKCITEVADYVTYYLSAFQDGNIFWKMIRANIVGIIVMISVPLWCIVGYYMTKYDQHQARILQDREMTHPNSELQFTNSNFYDRSPVQIPSATSRVPDDFF